MKNYKIYSIENVTLKVTLLEILQAYSVDEARAIGESHYDFPNHSIGAEPVTNK